MGLDSVELIMEFEDEFGISIDDESACEMRTIGHVAAYVSAKLGEATFIPVNAPCFTARTFYALRRQLMSCLAVARTDISPTARLRDLIPAHERRVVWNSLGAVGFSVPSLEVPWLLLVPLIALGTIVGIWTNQALGVLPMFVAIVLVATFGLWCLTPFGSELPRDCQTMGDLVRRSWPPISENESQRLPFDSETLRRIKVIVAAQMGVPFASLSPNTRFVEDLGC